MKRKFSLLFGIILMLLGQKSFAQKIEFSPEIKVAYKTQMKMGGQRITRVRTILIANSNEAYFGELQNFLNDSGQYAPAKPYENFRYISARFKERVIKNHRQYYTFYDDRNGKIKYKEQPYIKWDIEPEYKEVAGIKCQKAVTEKYGRKWIAYFAKTHYPFPAGPYKFGGLPGLILELQDSEGDYVFTAIKIEKYSENFTFNLNDYHTYNKKEYLKAFENMRFGISQFPIINDPDFRKKVLKVLARDKELHSNYIERKPFD